MLRAGRAVIVILVLGALLALGAQAYVAAVTNSGTSDEPEHIVSGLAALRTRDFRMNVAHPPLMEMLCGAAAAAADPPPLPTDSEYWRTAQQIRYANAYLWRGAAAEKAVRMIFLARLPVIAVSIALACLVFFWARRLYGWAAASLALLLYCFEPNLLAHSSLATNDLAVTAGWAVSVYAYWRYLSAPSRGKLALAGIALGAALLAKFSGALLLVVVPLLGVYHGTVVRRTSPARLIGSLGAIVALAMVIVWAGYGFGIQPIAKWQGALRLPAGQYILGVLYQWHHTKGGHPAYLLGATSNFGWWYYFPIAFLVKTPLPLLVLLGLGIARGRFKPDEWFLIVPAGLLLVVAMIEDLNYGLRHILPIYPFLIILTARVVGRPWPEARRRWANGLVAVVAVWMVAEALIYAPQYLTYFNELCGGPAGGSRVLADSNIDWGQDLPRLSAWQREHPEASPLYLSYFGTSDPVRYGVRAEPLRGLSPNYPMERMSPERRGTSTMPRTGWIAISENCLKLVPWYHWLRSHRPVARAGYSIVIYHIPET